MDMVAPFLRRQTRWLEEAKEACNKGYYIEVIGICVNQAHALLREGLWLHSRFEASKRPSESAPATESIQKLPESVPDRQLYGAAQRFGIISKQAAKTLNELYEQKTILLRDLLLHEDQDRNRDFLKAVAEQYLEVNEECLVSIQRAFTIAQGKTKALRRKQ